MANRRAPRKTVDITTAPGPNTTDTAQHTRCHWPTIRYLPCQRPGSQSPTCPDTVPTQARTSARVGPPAPGQPHIQAQAPSPPQAQAPSPMSQPSCSHSLALCWQPASPKAGSNASAFTGQRRNGSRCLESPLRGRHAFHLSVHSGHRSGHLHRSHSWRYERWPRSSHRRQ